MRDRLQAILYRPLPAWTDTTLMALENASRIIVTSLMFVALFYRWPLRQIETHQRSEVSVWAACLAVIAFGLAYHFASHRLGENTRLWVARGTLFAVGAMLIGRWVFEGVLLGLFAFGCSMPFHARRSEWHRGAYSSLYCAAFLLLLFLGIEASMGVTTAFGTFLLYNLLLEERPD